MIFPRMLMGRHHEFSSVVGASPFLRSRLFSQLRCFSLRTGATQTCPRKPAALWARSGQLFSNASAAARWSGKGRSVIERLPKAQPSYTPGAPAREAVPRGKHLLLAFQRVRNHMRPAAKLIARSPG